MSETVNISEKAQATAQRLFPEGGLSLGATDPEFIERHANFAFDEVMNHGTVDHAPVYPREVVRRALELSASAVILVLIHPTPPSMITFDHAQYR